MQELKIAPLTLEEIIERDGKRVFTVPVVENRIDFDAYGLGWQIVVAKEYALQGFDGFWILRESIDYLAFDREVTELELLGEREVE